MYPTEGCVDGLTKVTIQGAGFLNVTSLSCMFGGNEVTAKYEDANHIECMTPPAATHAEDSLVTVAISLNGQQYVESPVKFHYQSELHIISNFTEISPRA